MPKNNVKQKVAVDTRTVDEKIRDKHYESQVPYPQRKEYRIVEVLKSERLGEHQVEGFDEGGYMKALQAYNEDQARRGEEFKQDALRDCGIADHPKADLCYSKAWEHGHANGLHDVLNYLRDFSELLT